MQTGLDGKSVIITGAGSGIGRASALQFAAEGASVTVADVRGHKAQQTVDLVQAAGGRAIAVEVDVSQAAQLSAMVDRTLAEFGRLDVLFNNAATVRVGGAVELAEEDWDIVWRTNVSSVFLGAKYAAPHIAPGGSIISTASISGIAADENLIAYNATKAAVINLTRALAVDLSPKGIRVNCICPGVTLTPAMKGYLANERLHDLLVNTTPIRRLGQPDDIAAAAVWLASDAAGFVTGHSLVVDGGLTAQHAFSLMQQVD
ncbi:MAG: SDR family oxidoreductase [Actinomycetota bacterium]|nr:SDR family oxidoreductase [Actinomycetota bacterium]